MMQGTESYYDMMLGEFPEETADAYEEDVDNTPLTQAFAAEELVSPLFFPSTPVQQDEDCEECVPNSAARASESLTEEQIDENVAVTAEYLRPFLPILLQFGKNARVRAKIIDITNNPRRPANSKSKKRRFPMKVTVQYPHHNLVCIPGTDKNYVWENLSAPARQAYRDTTMETGKEVPYHTGVNGVNGQPGYWFYLTRGNRWVKITDKDGGLLPVPVRTGLVTVEEFLQTTYGEQWQNYLPKDPTEDVDLLDTSITCTRQLTDIEHLRAGCFGDRDALAVLDTHWERLAENYKTSAHIVKPHSKNTIGARGLTRTKSNAILVGGKARESDSTLRRTSSGSSKGSTSKRGLKRLAEAGLIEQRPAKILAPRHTPTTMQQFYQDACPGNNCLSAALVDSLQPRDIVSMTGKHLYFPAWCNFDWHIPMDQLKESNLLTSENGKLSTKCCSCGTLFAVAMDADTYQPPTELPPPPTETEEDVDVIEQVAAQLDDFIRGGAPKPPAIFPRPYQEYACERNLQQNMPLQGFVCPMHIGHRWCLDCLLKVIVERLEQWLLNKDVGFAIGRCPGGSKKEEVVELDPYFDPCPYQLTYYLLHACFERCTKLHYSQTLVSNIQYAKEPRNISRRTKSKSNAVDGEPATPRMTTVPCATNIGTPIQNIDPFSTTEEMNGDQLRECYLKLLTNCTTNTFQSFKQGALRSYFAVHCPTCQENTLSDKILLNDTDVEVSEDLNVEGLGVQWFNRSEFSVPRIVQCKNEACATYICTGCMRAVQSKDTLHPNCERYWHRKHIMVGQEPKPEGQLEDFVNDDAILQYVGNTPLFDRQWEFAALLEKMWSVAHHRSCPTCKFTVSALPKKSLYRSTSTNPETVLNFGLYGNLACTNGRCGCRRAEQYMIPDAQGKPTTHIRCRCGTVWCYCCERIIPYCVSHGYVLRANLQEELIAPQYICHIQKWNTPHDWFMLHNKPMPSDNPYSVAPGCCPLYLDAYREEERTAAESFHLDWRLRMFVENLRGPYMHAALLGALPLVRRDLAYFLGALIGSPINEI